MTEFIKTQNLFSDGEVSPEFFARDNINGLSKLENMDVLSGGGLSRRAGLKSIATLRGAARLISFSISDDEEYLIVMTDYHMYIYHNDTRYQDLITPWSYQDLSLLQYAQRFGTMIFVHPDHMPQVLSKDDDIFKMSDFAFLRNDSDMSVNIPFLKFDDASDITITVSANNTGNNYATLTTNKNFWTSDNVLGRLYFLERQWLITEYISPTQVVAYTNGSYTAPSNAISDWSESAFSNRRGWPCSITFHQDRLIFGGSRDWPSGIWMSHVGVHDNFNVGTGLDNEAIFITLLSKQRQQICTIVSSDNLQILTNVGEWVISNSPLTPSSVNIMQHTSVGSYPSHYLPPQKIENTTIFISGNGHDVRELSLDEIGGKYNANDLCALSKHLLHEPTDMTYNASQRRLYIVRSDGEMAVLNRNSTLGISAWGTYKTNGRFLSVCTCDNKTYAVIARGDNFLLEYFDVNEMYDCGNMNISFCASGLPLRFSKHNAQKFRVRKLTARVIDTKSVFINNHRVSLPNEIYTSDCTGFSGDVSINLFGTSGDFMKPIWVIHGSEPYPITVISVTIYGSYSI